MAKKLLRKALSVLAFGKGGSEGTPCGYCPIHIFEEHEAGHAIHYRDGKAICARCRVLGGKMGGIIAGDKAKRDEDVNAMNEKVQKQADSEALVVAERTQRDTRTKR